MVGPAGCPVKPSVRGRAPGAPPGLRLHGLLGKPLDETEHVLPRRLADAGSPSITFSTALADLGLFFGFGLLQDSLAQIRAGCDADHAFTDRHDALGDAVVAWLDGLGKGPDG
jgi:hypothetical protein